MFANRVSNITFAIGLLAACLSGMSQADLNETANDWKGYNGSYCKATNSMLDVRSRLSGISNWEDSPTTIYCPVARDVAEGGGNRVEAAVSLFNNNSQSGGYCTLVSRDINNKITVDSHRVYWPSGYEEHTVRLGPVDSSNWGNYMVYCRVPGKEGNRKTVIRSIRIDEQN